MLASAHISEYALHSRLVDGQLPSLEEIHANAHRLSLLSVAYWAELLCAAVAFLVWLHRASRNLPALGARDLEFTPAGAVDCFFMPIANLVWPYQAVAEVARGSDPRQGNIPDNSWQWPRGSLLVGCWWAGCLVSNVYEWVASLAADSATSVDGVSAACRSFIIGDAISMIVAGLAIAVILMIDRRQEERNWQIVETLAPEIVPESREMSAWQADQPATDAPGYSPHKVYGMKRRFSLVTIIVMIVAASLFWAILTAVGAQPQLGGGLLALIAFTAMSQMFLFGGQRPRLASILTGIVFVAVLESSFGLPTLPLFNGAIFVALFWGSIAGYGAGGAVGGVLLFMELVESWLTNNSAAPQIDSQPWPTRSEADNAPAGSVEVSNLTPSCSAQVSNDEAARPQMPPIHAAVCDAESVNFGNSRSAPNKMFRRPLNSEGMPRHTTESGYSPEKVYGMKGRFSLATIIVMVVAASLLLAMLKALNVSPVISGLILLFIVTAAVGQMFLYGGQDPRRASIVLGAVFWAIVGIFAYLIDLRAQFVPGMILLVGMCALHLRALVGGLAGYARAAHERSRACCC